MSSESFLAIKASLFMHVGIKSAALAAKEARHAAVAKAVEDARV